MKLICNFTTTPIWFKLMWGFNQRWKIASVMPLTSGIPKYLLSWRLFPLNSWPSRLAEYKFSHFHMISMPSSTYPCIQWFMTASTVQGFTLTNMYVPPRRKEASGRGADQKINRYILVHAWLTLVHGRGDALSESRRANNHFVMATAHQKHSSGQPKY